jgi:hypothetical protein
LREELITEDDLKQFGNVLQDAVKQLQERMEEWMHTTAKEKTYGISL